jgi:DNA-directed RNA polymerase subunit M/transcription elongation factor TFIIS
MAVSDNVCDFKWMSGYSARRKQRLTKQVGQAVSTVNASIKIVCSWTMTQEDKNRILHCPYCSYTTPHRNRNISHHLKSKHGGLDQSKKEAETVQKLITQVKAECQAKAANLEWRVCTDTAEPTAAYILTREQWLKLISK